MSEESRTKVSAFQRICGFLIWLLRVVSMPVEMLLHVNVGERYFGFTGLFALLLMVICASICPSNESGPLAWLLIAFIVRILIYDFSGNSKVERNGLPRHSRDVGGPLLGFWAGRVERDWLRAGEAILVILAGMLIAMGNPPLGDYLVCAGGAMLGVLGLNKAILRHRLLDRLDAEIEREAEAVELRKRLSSDRGRASAVIDMYVNDNLLMARKNPSPIALIESRPIG